MFNLRAPVGFWRRSRWVLLIGWSLLAICDADSALAALAFPGAEGYGANASGGRGGVVYHVTSLADTNTTGTLRYGLSHGTGGTTIVFDVSGTIEMTSKLQVNRPNITIAGQTAPGQGICLKNYPFEINANNVIVRDIRSRLGTDANQQEDSMTLVGGDNIIVDHCSASWSVDEVFSVKQGATVAHATVQNCLMTEALNNSIHDKGAHGYGSLIRPGVNCWLSWYGNLYADNMSRNPRPGYDTSQTVIFDFRNNVIYNWSDQAGYTAADGSGMLNMNYVNNYALQGPSGNKQYIFNGYNVTALQIYQSGNKMDTNKNGIADGVDNGWGMFTAVLDGSKMTSEFAMDPNYPSVTTVTADQALANLLNSGGAFFWNRDAADANVIAQVASYGKAGAIYDTVVQAGGYPLLLQLSRDPNYDTDGDGMPNTWELAHGLNPNDPNDRNNYGFSSDYTNLEMYLDEIAIPEPATAGLLVVGAFGLLSRRRSQRRRH